MIASMVLLWIAVVVLAVLVFALARQVGLLHTRLAPAGALMTSAGPKVGEEAPRLELDTVSGDSVVIGGPQEQHQLVFFISPKCPICKSLVPVAQSLLKADKRLSLVFASDGGEPEQHQRYVRDLGIEAFPYVVSLELGMKFEVGKLPYAVLIKQRRRAAFKGPGQQPGTSGKSGRVHGQRLSIHSGIHSG